MSNSYFSFKQFTIHQDRCAMKVCTDACLFGAWAVRKLNIFIPSATNILDIGTGTGLLSLMLAQKSIAEIHAVEIEQGAADQAKENFSASLWYSRLKVYHTSIQSFKRQAKYSFIITNPPFYEDDLHSPDQNRNAAMHDSELTLNHLIAAIDTHLTSDGFAAILLPVSRSGFFETTAIRRGLHVAERCYVRQTPTHAFFRVMLLVSRDKPYSDKETELTIHDNDRNYTDAFTELLKDYYLKL